MDINQAFEILRCAGGVRAARIITEHNPKIGRIGVWRAARALRRGVPVAKIIGRRWFYGMEFYTNKYTLDPRPDTETLVECVLADIPQNGPVKILDIGTGTGCIIAAICSGRHATTGVGIDISRGAIRVARRNIKKLNLQNRVNIIRRDFNSARGFDAPFDVIVTNPPYIAMGDARVDAGAQHDPRLALYADDNGYAAYGAIAKNARAWIRDGGRIYMEIGIDMAPRVRDIFTHNGWKYIDTKLDLGGVPRVLVFQK